METRSRIILPQILEIVKSGKELIVVDDRGEDITRVILGELIPLANISSIELLKLLRGEK
jgi:polyhydroxyalkanoate synthesis regulator protein